MSEYYYSLKSRNWLDILINDITVVLAVSITVGIALKFVYFQILVNEATLQGKSIYYMYFPYFPNLLDSTGLIISSVYLAFRARVRPFIVSHKTTIVSTCEPPEQDDVEKEANGRNRSVLKDEGPWQNGSIKKEKEKRK